MAKKTKLEIIQETVDYYSEDPKRRGLNKGGECVYFTKDGCMCAVGRCLSIRNPKIKKIKEKSILENWTGDVSDLMSITGLSTHVDIDSILKIPYRGHNIKFWSDLQDFHDNVLYWNWDGLTISGINKVKELNREYKDG